MMAQKASDGPPYHGYLIYGNPTINGTSMTPTAGGFIYTTVPFDPGSSPWEIHCRVTRHGTSSSGDMICTVADDGGQWLGYRWKTTKSGSTGVIRIYASSNGTSWDLLNNYSVAGLYASSGSWNSVAFRNGTTYSFQSKSTVRTATLSTPPLFGCHIAFGGGYDASPCNLSFDLTEAKIYIDGKLYWSAI